MAIPALIGWGKGGNVTSAGWQVTLWSQMACWAPTLVRHLADCYLWLLYFTL